MTGAGAVRGERGQASVELVGLLPLLVVVGLAASQVLVGALTRERAGAAAQAAAMALAAGADPVAAAREAVPGAAPEDLAVRRDGRRVTVRLRPRLALPPLTGRLTAEVAADAGPEP